MQQLRNALEAIPLKSRILTAAAVLAVGAGIFAFVRWEREQRFRPLYTALAPEDAAGIIEKLKETGVEYRVTGNGTTVEIAADNAAEIRLQLAAGGLPRTGRIGFELFDKANFGATDFTEHVNFRRALEGELERSVMSLNEVEHARVHLTFAKDSVFLESRQPAKASVLVRLRPGASLQPGSVVAVTHLISSAVEGLAPEAVSVLDMRGNLLSRPRRAAAAGAAELPDAVLEHQQQIERNLLAKINSTLEPLLGDGKFRAAISVDCDFTSGEHSEEVFDPSRSVMVSSQRTEDASQTAATAGIPGTASSLPRAEPPVAGPRGGLSRRTESVAYQSSRTVKRTRVPQGIVRRVSASVLVDHILRWEGQGPKARRIIEPSSPEQMKSIRDLVAGAIALNAERGDQLIVESVPFESTLHAEPPVIDAPPKALPKPVIQEYFDKMQANPAIGIGVAAGAVLLLVVVGWMFSRASKKRSAARTNQQIAAPAAAALQAGDRPTGGETASLLAPPIQVGKRIEAATTQLREGSGKDASMYATALTQWLEREG